MTTSRLLGHHLGGKPWLLSTAAGVVAPPVTAFYVAPSGSDSNPGTLAAPFATPTRAQAAMAASQTTKTTYVRAGTYPVSLTLGSADNNTQWLAYNNEQPIFAATSGTANTLLYANGTTGLQIYGLSFTGVANTANHAAVELWNCVSPNISGNHFYANGNNSILLVATTQWTISGNQFDGGFCAVEAVNASDNGLYDSNLCTGMTNTNTAGGGFYGHGLSHCVISHNQVVNCGGIGIGILDFGPAGTTTTKNTNNEISHNLVTNCGSASPDCGAIYMLGRGMFDTATLITGNMVDGVTQGRAIYLDDETRGVTVSRNIMRGVAANNIGEIHGGRNNTWISNIMHFSSGTLGLLLQKADADLNVASSDDIGNNTISSNIFFADSGTPTPYVSLSGGTNNITGNMYASGTTPVSGEIDAAPVYYTDPTTLFNAPDSSDYTPKSSSPVLTLSGYTPPDQTLYGLTPSGVHWYVPPAHFTPTVTGGPAALTGIIWHQPEAIDPASEDYTIAGWGEPIGGIGPYVWSTPDAGNFACFAVYGARGVVRVFGGMPTNLTFRLQCTDARGVTVIQNCTVAVASSSPHMSCNDINPTTAATLDTFYNGPFFRPTAPGLQYVSTGVTMQDGSASSQWVGNYGPKWYQGGAAVIPPGDYPVKFTGTSNGTAVSENYTIHILPTPTTGFIELALASVSTASVPFVVIGIAHATTPNNVPSWSITSTPTNIFAINDATGEVRLINVPQTPGTYAYSITVKDQTYSYTQSFSLVVAQGVTLDPSIISFTPNAFNNYFYRAEYSQRPVGTPTITSAFPDASKVTWAITARERTNWMMDNPKSTLLAEDDDARGGVGSYRFVCNASTGAVVVCAPLSDTTGTPGEWFDLTATDGVRVCTHRVYVPVTPCVGPKYYVGPNTPPTGFTSQPTITAALSAILGWAPETDVTAVAGMEIRIEYDPANPLRYCNDWEQNYSYVRRGYNGPFMIVGIPGPNGELPILGGTPGSSNTHIGDQGLLYCNNGDVTFKNLNLGFVHNGTFGNGYIPASNYTMSLIRRAGGCSGDVHILNCDIHDADVPLEAGNSDGYWTIDSCRIYNGSGCTSGGGANQHNAYIGMIAKLTVTNTLSYNCANGHIFKTRAKLGIWDHSRFYDAERGSGFNAVDLCCGGDHTFTYCHFEKGPAAENPYMIQFGEELPGANRWDIAAQDYRHALSFDHCTFTNHATHPIWATGEHGAAAINFVGKVTPNTGRAATLSVTNSTFEGYTSTQIAVFSSNLDPTVDFSQNFTQSGNTFSATVFTPLNVTTPVSYDTGRPGWHDAVAQIGGSAQTNFPYFSDVQIDPGVDEIRIAHTAAPGTLVCTLQGYGAPNYSLSGNTQPDPRIAPFVAGTQWTAGQTLVAYTGETFGYAHNNYTFNTLANGNGEVRVGSAGLGTAGLDVILPRGTSPASTGSIIVEIPLFIVKT